MGAQGRSLAEWQCAEIKRGEVAGFYVKRRENLTPLSREEAEKRVLEIVETARRRVAGLDGEVL